MQRARTTSQYDASVKCAMNRRRFGTIVAAALTLAVVPVVVPRAPAQERTVVVEGKGTWIAGNKMAVAPPGGCPSRSISPADLSAYASWSATPLSARSCRASMPRYAAVAAASAAGDRRRSSAAQAAGRTLPWT